MSSDPRGMMHKQNASTRKSSKREQNLREADRQVRLQGKALKVVSKSSGISVKEIRDFVDAKLELRRLDEKSSKTQGREQIEARITQAVAACQQYQPGSVAFILDYHCNTNHLISIIYYLFDYQLISTDKLL